MKQFSYFSLSNFFSSFTAVLGLLFLNPIQAENNSMLGPKGVTGLILSTTGPTGPTGSIEVKRASSSIEIKSAPHHQTYSKPSPTNENPSKKTDVSPLKDLERSKMRLKTPKKKPSSIKTVPVQKNVKPSTSQTSEKYHYEIQTELYEVEPNAKEHETEVESDHDSEVESHVEEPSEEEEHHEEEAEPEEHHEEPAEEEHHEEEAEPEEHHEEPAEEEHHEEPVEEEHHEEASEPADDSSDSDD